MGTSAECERGVDASGVYQVIYGTTCGEDACYLTTGVKGCSKIRRVLAKPRLILDEMCRLHGKFASYFSSYKWP